MWQPCWLKVKFIYQTMTVVIYLFWRNFKLHFTSFKYFHEYVLGRVVKVVDFKPLAPQSCTDTLDSFMWGSYPASLRNVGGSTQVPVRAWNNARKGTWGPPPPVKLERRDMTCTVSMWRKTQNKQTNKQTNKAMCRNNAISVQNGGHLWSKWFHLKIFLNYTAK
jgi:hypothetical protein